MNGKPSPGQRHPAAAPRWKSRVTGPAAGLWKEPLFPDPPPDSPPQATAPDTLSDLPPPLYDGDIVPEALAPASAGPVDAPAARRERYEWLLIVLAVLLLGTLLLTYVAEPIPVLGASMLPTLQTGEYVLVTKLDYRRELPQRFQVVACRFPDQPYTYVKRVVGLPGERISLRGGTLYVDGLPIPPTFLYLPDAPDFESEPIPEGHLFVLGDNRANSMDSRDPAVGTLEASAIVGRVRYVLYPLSSIRSIDIAHP